MITRRLFIVLTPVALFIAVLTGMAWLLLSEAGLSASTRLAMTLSGERLRLEQVSGRLYDHLNIGHLHWQDEGSEIEIRDLALHWSALALLHGKLEVHDLTLSSLHIHTPGNTPPSPLPTSLALPVSVSVKTLTIGELQLNEQVLATQLHAQLSSHNGKHELQALQLQRGPLTFEAHGHLDAHAPFALQFDGALKGKLDEKDYGLALQAHGTLARSELSARQTSGPFSLNATATLQPYAPQVLAALALQARDLDLAALLPEMPHTRIDADCQLATTPAQALASNCRLRNRLAGPIDRQRLPLSALSTRLQLEGDTLGLHDLNLTLGQGRLTGQASLDAQGAHVQLQALALNLLELHTSARRTRLNGPLTLQSSTAGIALSLRLREADSLISAELQQQGDQLELHQLELSALPARLLVHGKLHLRTREFNASGNLERFDPARFARLPAGNVNGKFTAHGRLDTRPDIDFDFALRDSRLAQAPLEGRGKLSLTWPQVRQADIALQLGRNSLQLKGAFGRATDKLHLNIDAPALTPYGMPGELQAQLELSGTPASPLLNGQVRSTTLQVPGYLSWQQLSLNAHMGAAENAPLELHAHMEKLTLAGHSVSPFKLDLSGSRNQHSLQLTTRLEGRRPLQLALQGGFAAKRPDTWQGKLTQLSLDVQDNNRSLRLDGPAALTLSATQWSLGPLRMLSPQAAFMLNANAAPGKLQAQLRVDGTKAGWLQLDLAARNDDAWALSAQMPWQGRLQAQLEDLAWLAPLLGDAWQVGGSVSADVRIAGTPQQPLLNGNVSGKQLALRQLDRGMQLQNGSLRASVQNSLLKLDEFHIDSVLNTPPQNVQRLLGDKWRGLTATPGRLSAQGYMRLGAYGAAEATGQVQLDFTLDRLGVAQTPKQWLLLSGQGKLGWQQGRLNIGAQLEVNAAHWQLAELSRPQLSADVVIRSGDSSEEQRSTPWRGQVDINLGPAFSFEGAGARGRLAGNIGILASAGDLARASGSVNLVDGRYDAYGQKLDIERGILNFQGLLENPALNIRALRKGLAVEAGVEIGGYAQSPRVRLVSEPNVPDTEKLSWLVLGRPPEQEGADASILLSAVGAIFGNDVNSVGTQVQQTFGIDELTVRSGTLGQQQRMGSRIISQTGSTQTAGQVLAVGRQLSSRLRLSYEQALGGTGSLVKLTLKLGSRLSVVGTSGSEAAFDVFYGFAFGGANAATRPTTPQTRP